MNFLSVVNLIVLLWSIHFRS